MTEELEVPTSAEPTRPAAPLPGWKQAATRSRSRRDRDDHLLRRPPAHRRSRRWTGWRTALSGHAGSASTSPRPAPGRPCCCCTAPLALDALGLERGRLIATPWPWRSPGWAPGPPARARAGTALHRQYALRDIVPVLAAGTAPSGSPCPPRILAGADDFGLVVRAALDLLER
jgi:hypothetical protein